MLHHWGRSSAFSIFLLHFYSIFSSTYLLGINNLHNDQNIFIFLLLTDLQHWLLCVNCQSFRGTGRRYNFDQSLSVVWRYGWRCDNAVLCTGKLVTVYQSNDVCWTPDQLRDSDWDENVLQVQIRKGCEYGIMLCPKLNVVMMNIYESDFKHCISTRLKKKKM